MNISFANGGEPPSGLGLPTLLRPNNLLTSSSLIRGRPPILGFQLPVSKGEVTRLIGEEIRPTGEDTGLPDQEQRVPLQTGD